MPIGLMNLLLQAGSKAGPILRAIGKETGFLRQTPKPKGAPPGWAQKWFDPRKNKPVYSKGRELTTPSARTGGPQGPVLSPGRRGKLYGDSPLARGIRMGATGLGGWVAADRLHDAIFGEEKEAQVGDTQRRPLPSYEAGPGFEDMESRQSWESRRHKKLNKDMHRLLQYYGIVNLVNPDQAAKMLELGSALVQQDIEMLGDERQAKIFDAVFSRGQLPRSAREAFDRVIGAKGTIDDAKEIAGIYADMAPSSSDLAKDERATQILQQADALIAAGYDSQAQQLILNAIYSKIIERVKNEQGVMELSPEQQAQIMVERRGGRKEGVEGGGGIEIEAA